METHTLGTGLFVELILTQERNETSNVDKDGVNGGNANLYEDDCRSGHCNLFAIAEIAMTTATIISSLNW